ncbi:MAG: hypothetical protein LBK61_09365 [Spirochaetaceae bacterium]|jgi:uncharacterized integral membrane protein|nr:hypothetical protein [Spirochaetaceae bacterium]
MRCENSAGLAEGVFRGLRVAVFALVGTDTRASAILLGKYMRRTFMFILLFAVVLVFVVFLGLNWKTQFNLQLGFGSDGVSVSIIAWTMGAFVVGVFCTAIVFATNLLRKGRKKKDLGTEKSMEKNE